MAEAMTIEKKHPKGLYLLFTVEMWERLSYYGMRAILMLFMVKFLIFTTELAGQLYGWYCGLVYLTPLAGGYLADRYLGQRRSIVIGAIVMAMGEFALMFSGLSMNLDKQVIAIVLTEEQKTAIAANGQLEIDLNGTQSDTVKSIWKDIETSKASIKQQDIVKNKHVAVTMEGGAVSLGAHAQAAEHDRSAFWRGIGIADSRKRFFQAEHLHHRRTTLRAK